ncbi:hypothetical protein TIFTF001_001595 [Ficus carica]|uniref:Transposase n=1 Tax=Ficus carica TaxID=3494 RepID=A0AA88CS30_FICCA|nr:hypothetical protein TIFTF001_001595 [Ficus carica]
MDELKNVQASKQPRTQTGPQMVDLTEEEDATIARSAGQQSTSGWEKGSDEESDSSGSATPQGELIHARQRGHPVYTVDYFTSAVTPEYLESLREEFQIPNDIDLVVPSLADLPSSPSLGHVTLSAEFFLASLHLSFHPFLRRVFRRLNIAPMQLNANAYRILINCFGYQGKFIEDCPDWDKHYKHLWFYATGKWLSGRNDYRQSRLHRPEEETVTVVVPMSNLVIHYCAQTLVPADGAIVDGRSEAGRIQEEPPGSIDPPTKARRDDQRSQEPPESVTWAELIRRKSSVQMAIIAKFNDCLTFEVAESSRCSGHIQASKVGNLLHMVSFVFSGNAAARSHSLHMDEEGGGLDLRR